MIYVKEDYENYKYLVSVSDNYVVLTNQSRANNEEIDIIYQYINSPFTVIESTKTYGQFQEVYFDEIETSQNIMDSSMYPFYVLSVLAVVMFIVFIINPITKIAKKGGIFFGS